MLNFLPVKIIKKIVLPLSLIIFVSVSIISPITTYAGGWDTFLNITTGVGTLGLAPGVNAIYNSLTGSQGTVGEKIASGITDKLTKMAGDVAEQTFMAIIYAITWLINFILGTLSSFFTMALAWIMDASTTGSLSFTHISGADANPAVALGWPIVRDLSNMIIVLGFVVIGISTALRVREYEAKKLLGKLILIALLINFSLVFCGLFIDAANITSNSFLKSSNFFTKTWAQSVWGAGDSVGVGFDKLDPEKTSTFVAKCVSLVFQNIVLIIVAGAYFFLFLFRYMALWILVILSPLAFVCWVFPFTKKIWNMWWSNFFQWCIIIVPAAFFMWIADKINNEMVTKNLDPVAGGAGAETANMFLNMLVFLIPGFFMLIGLFISIQIAPMGASAAIGLAGSVGGYALGAAGKGAGALANKTGLSRVGERISNSAGQLAERWGLRPEGSTVASAARTAKATQDRVGNLSIDRQTQLAGGGVNPLSINASRDRVAAIKNLAEKGELHRLGDISKQAQAIAFVESYEKGLGLTSNVRKDAEEHNYQLRAFNQRAVDTMVSNGSAPNHIIARDRLVKQQLIDNLSKMSTSELGRIDPSHLDYDTFKEHFTPNIVNKMATAPSPLRTAIRSHIGRLQTDAASSRDRAERTRLNKLANATDRATT